MSVKSARERDAGRPFSASSVLRSKAVDERDIERDVFLLSMRS